MYEKPIKAIGKVIKLRSEDLAYVSLPNGKEILAHRAKSFSHDLLTISIDAQVKLEMTTFDFEKGRIIEITS